MRFINLNLKLCKVDEAHTIQNYFYNNIKSINNLEGDGQEIRGRRAIKFWSFCDSHNIEYECSAIICHVQDFIV